MTAGWIGVDLDGTLAEYDGWVRVDQIGAPVPVMVERVRAWLAGGREVRIFTARLYGRDPAEVTGPIHAWLAEQGLPELAVTNVKDPGMIELWDDRCIRVERNTGLVVPGELSAIVDSLAELKSGTTYAVRIPKRLEGDQGVDAVRTLLSELHEATGAMFAVLGHDFEFDELKDALYQELNDQRAWVDKLGELIPESYDCDDAMEAIVTRYITDLVAENARIQEK